MAMVIEELTRVLTLERDLLDDLAYAVAAERALRSGDGDHAAADAAGLRTVGADGADGGARRRWADRAAGEAVDTGIQLRDLELLRSLRAEEIALGLGLEPGPTLVELAGALVEPWRGALLRHRAELLAASAEVDRAAGRRPAAAPRTTPVTARTGLDGPDGVAV